MADDLDRAMDAVFEEGSSPQPEPQPEPQPAPEPAPEPQPEPAPEPAPEPQPQPEPDAKDHTVPLPKYLDLRDEVKELRRYRQEQEAKAQAPKAPDPFDDPDGYRAHQEQRVQAALAEQKFQLSDVMARQTHGADTVESAAEWALKRAQEDPTFAAQYMREPHPIDWIVRQHKRDGIVSKLPDDVSSLDELVEREIAKRGLTAAPAGGAVPPAQQQQAPAPAAPTPSLVNAPSSGGVKEVPIGPVAGVEAVFPR